LEAFDVVVVDFDGAVAPYRDVQPLVGPWIVQAAQQEQAAPGHHITYRFASPADFNYDPTAVREAIWHFDYWAAIVINPNATALLQEAVRIGNASYDPRGVCTTTYVSARDQVAAGWYVPFLEAFQVAVTDAVGSRWTQQVLGNITADTNATALAEAARAISPAIGFTTYDLRPFAPAEATPAVTVGLIYLIIVAFFSFTFFMPTHSHFVNAMEGHNKVYFAHLVVWKYCSTVGAYVFMSLAYSLVSLAFNISFSAQPGSHTEVVSPANAYGHASFVVYWMINFIGMCALGLACENMAMLLGTPWTALWLIFWVITNVSTAFYPLETAPGFYLFGLAWPLHSVVEATRVILFDVTSRMGLHVGILLAWWAVNTALFPVFATWFRYVNCVKSKKSSNITAKSDTEKTNDSPYAIASRLSSSRAAHEDV
jgi:hypothetical protein